MTHQRSIDKHVKEAMKGFIQEFKKESDRAAVILGTAKLDLLLLQLLQKFLLPSVSNNDELLGGDAALSTFSSRIHACYRLGLIDDALTRSLHLIRRIRNIFAHEISGADLENPAHRGRIRELAAPLQNLPGFKSFMESNDLSRLSGAAAEFRAVLALVCVRLQRAVELTEPLKRDQCFTLLPSAWNPLSKS